MSHTPITGKKIPGRNIRAPPKIMELPVEHEAQSRVVPGIVEGPVRFGATVNNPSTNHGSQAWEAALSGCYTADRQGIRPGGKPPCHLGEDCFRSGHALWGQASMVVYACLFCSAKLGACSDNFDLDVI